MSEIANFFAPVALFVYKRLEHTKNTLDALVANPESINTDLIVFSDAANCAADFGDVTAVRNHLNSISGFKSVTLVFRESNYGLAKNIICGVSQVCESFGRVIVLEDDIVTSPGFLHFMNAALNRYSDEKRVWHISGWNYPLPTDVNQPEAFFWRTMNCWGWATWSDRWYHFEKDPDALVGHWSADKIDKFNLDGACDFWSQVIQNKKLIINTWAVFWYATIFSNGGLCLNPIRSFVLNTGLDGTGQNCECASVYDSKLEERFKNEWPIQIEENKLVVGLIRDFCFSLQPSFLKRIVSIVRRNIKFTR